MCHANTKRDGQMNTTAHSERVNTTRVKHSATKPPFCNLETFHINLTGGGRCEAVL